MCSTSMQVEVYLRKAHIGLFALSCLGKKQKNYQKKKLQSGRTELREPFNILSLTWMSANGIHKNPPDSKPGNTTTLLPGERFIYSIAQMHTDTNALSSSITAYIPWYPVYWVYTLVPYILDQV